MHEYDDLQLFFAYLGKTLTELYGHGDELFTQWYKLAPEPADGLREIINSQSIDVVHSHNAPDSLTNLFIELFGDQIPVIHDIHDLLSVRDTPYQDGFANNMVGKEILAEERGAIERSQAVIAVSDEIFRITSQQYCLPSKILTFPNYIPQRFVPPSLPEKTRPNSTRARIVYQGFLSNNNGHYDLTQIFAALAETGVELHIYPSRDNPSYRAFAAASPNIAYHNHLSPEQLFPELTQYDFGWAGFNSKLNKRHLDTVLPNKAFDYIACGVPVITFPHKSLKAFIETHDLGIVIEDMADLKQALDCESTEKLHQNVTKKRYQFTVEAHIHKVRHLYEQLML